MLRLPRFSLLRWLLLAALSASGLCTLKASCAEGPVTRFDEQLGWIDTRNAPWLWSHTYERWWYSTNACDAQAAGLWGFSPSSAPIDLQSALLLHLTFADGSTADVGPVQRGVTDLGSAAGEGIDLGSRCFDGINDALRIEDFSYGRSFTVAFWFRSRDNSGTAFQYMFSHGAIHQANSGSYYFVEDSNTNNETPGTIKTNLLDADDPDRSRLFNTEPGLADGTWRHYTVSVAASGACVYIDGQLHRCEDQGGGPFNPSGPIAIGGRQDFASGRYFDGCLDEVRVYDRALTAAEVLALWLSGRS